MNELPFRLFDVDDVAPEVPLFRPPRRSRGENDARFRNDYPPDWHRCTTCGGRGIDCPDCFGMGSLKGRVRREAGHRCVRCKHPYMPKADATRLGVEATPFRWSPCDGQCSHRGPIRALDFSGEWQEYTKNEETPLSVLGSFARVEAEWRILTVHHLDGDKANCYWWNLAALCQRCHLEIQAKVVMERVYPHEHSEWFRPFVAGYYARVYLGLSLTRGEVERRMDELLALERQPIYRSAP